MKKGFFKADGLLLITAIIWGFAFVAQRMGMEHMGPFTFNGVRFALGGLSLIPLLLFGRAAERRVRVKPDAFLIKGGILAGVALFAGASLQQVGVVYTTAGKAGFITGLYVVIVPFLGLFLRKKTGIGIWIGALMAVVGMYFLSVTGGFQIGLGDLLVFASAFFWAGHVLTIDYLAARADSLKIAFIQFMVCSILSFIVAFAAEDVQVQGIIDGAIPVLYGGIMSVGVAYTLQIVAQKNAHPAHAAIILSLESVFAVLGGWLVLSEGLTLRGLLGCALMLAGMVLAQVQVYRSAKR